MEQAPLLIVLCYFIWSFICSSRRNKERRGKTIKVLTLMTPSQRMAGMGRAALRDAVAAARAQRVCRIFQQPDLKESSAPSSPGTACPEPLARRGKGKGWEQFSWWGYLPHLVQEVRLQWPWFLAQFQGRFVEPDQGVFSLVLLRECRHCLAGQRYHGQLFCLGY